MPGTFIVKPIEANLSHNTDIIKKMNPYCTIAVGETRLKGDVCKHGGKHPHWNDTIVLPPTKESTVLVTLMDKDRISHDDPIGSFVLNLKEIEASGNVSRWYPLVYKNKAAGEILIEAVYEPEVKKEESKNSTVWTEQKQVIEPHTFMKEVEVVETRPGFQEIEVMEPYKVKKNVQYTQAVPVKKQIEVVEPQVVIKEVEVIEPRLVTKTIQVVENVPVVRQIEVVEMKNTLKEVETYEHQSFNKEVEVTEYMPVKKQVEVSHPVTVKKAVEFVEPVITTQTITKELHHPVVISEQFTTSVGPASVLGASGYGFAQDFGKLSINEKKQLDGLQRWIGYEKIFDGLSEEEKTWHEHRFSRMSEQEWICERDKLMKLSKTKRIEELRKHYDDLGK